MISIIILVFVLGYLAIAMEHTIKVNKAASALLIGVVTWALYILNAESLVDTSTKEFSDFMTTTGSSELNKFVEWQLAHFLGHISEILFFLLGAMTIVELIDAHEGFAVITNRIRTTNKVKLLWVISIVTFFLSAALDNLTTSIVMISLLRKLIDTRENRMFYAGMVIIAANAGGAWSPIGDVTTTMLWIGGQITAVNIIKTLILPSIVCLVVPLIYLTFTMKGNIQRPAVIPVDTGLHHAKVSMFERNLVFGVGLGGLLFVPVFKTVTHLPPYMGMLFSLAILWVLTEILHKSKNEEVRESTTVVGVIRKVDTPSVLFFLGILVAIGSLQSTGVLVDLAGMLDAAIGDWRPIVVVIGLLSAIVDNVPLVAAAMGMYDMTTYGVDNPFWEFLAYCAGTGGSALIIGSAAGVAVMGMERIDFMWYMKKISLLALLGYLAGAVVYLLTYPFFMVH